MLYNKIDGLIAEAMKSKDDVRLNVLRLIKSEFIKVEKNSIEIDLAKEASILGKMVNQHTDSIEQFKSANRLDLVEIEEKQLAILNEFAPKKVSDEEIEILAKHMLISFLSSKESTYVLSMKDIKPILSLVQDIHPSANGAIVSKVIRENLKNK